MALNHLAGSLLNHVPGFAQLSGVFYIGGMDIVDYQTRFEFRLHDNIQVQNDLETVSNLLYTKTSFPLGTRIKVIEHVLTLQKTHPNPETDLNSP